MSLLNKILFRSRSDGSIRSPRQSPTGTPKNSPQTSPKSSPCQVHKRRFVRVVKDAEASGEEYQNPHVIRKYTRGYVKERYMPKSTSLDDNDRPLPYTVTGHTILKKHHSLENHSQSEEGLNKHASFSQDVEVVRFDKKSKCSCFVSESAILHARLQDDIENASDSSWSESLTDQEIPESDEDHYLEEEENDRDDDPGSGDKKHTTFNLDNVEGEDMSPTEESQDDSMCKDNNSDNCTKQSDSNASCSQQPDKNNVNKHGSPKLVKQLSDDGLPAPKKSKFGVRSVSLDSAEAKSLSRDNSSDESVSSIVKDLQIET